jgi:hypothetical protein
MAIYAKLFRKERRQLQRVKPAKIERVAVWTCTGCQAVNRSPITRSRLGGCRCGKVVVLLV